MTTYLSYAIEMIRKPSRSAKNMKRYTWEMHPAYEMD
jgi:hypothetical protein